MPAENTFSRSPIISLFLVTFIMSLLVIFLLEAILRLTPYKVFVETGQGAFPPMFVTDEKAGFDLAANYKGGRHSTIETEYSVHTNNIACFDNEVSLNESHNILVGDSFTWGFAPLDKKWTTILEKNTGQKFVKCGVPAYGPQQALSKLKKVVNVIGKAPKTIIYSYYWNDLNDDHTGLPSTVFEGNLINRIKSFNYDTGEVEYFSEKELIDTYQQYKKYGDSDYQSLSAFKKLKYWIKSNSIIANLIHNYISSFNPPVMEALVKGNTAQYKTYLSKMSVEEYPWLDKAWDKHLENIDEMINYAKTLDSKFMIIILPTKDQVYPANDAAKKTLLNLTRSQMRLKKFLEDRNVLYFDLFDEFSKAAKNTNNLYLSNDLHFTTEGEALAGKVISDFLQKSKFLDASE